MIFKAITRRKNPSLKLAQWYLERRKPAKFSAKSENNSTLTLKKKETITIDILKSDYPTEKRIIEGEKIEKEESKSGDSVV